MFLILAIFAISFSIFFLLINSFPTCLNLFLKLKFIPPAYAVALIYFDSDTAHVVFP